MVEAVRKAPSWVTRVLLPEIGEMKGDIRALDTKVDSLRTEFRSELKVMQTKLDSPDKKLDIDRRMTVVEAKLKDLEKRS
jgi:Skp family chaperone for outer membrane proteins